MYKRQAEHHAILNTAKDLKARGRDVHILRVDKYGMVSPRDIGAVLKDGGGLVSVMAVNNEVGTINQMCIRDRESTVRVYPKQSTAAHTIGYWGSIVSDNEIEKYIDQEGYDAGDFIGKTGIEATMEEYLTASSKEKQGQKV